MVTGIQNVSAMTVASQLRKKQQEQQLATSNEKHKLFKDLRATATNGTTNTKQQGRKPTPFIKSANCTVLACSTSRTSEMRYLLSGRLLLTKDTLPCLHFQLLSPLDTYRGLLGLGLYISVKLIYSYTVNLQLFERKYAKERGEGEACEHVLFR